MTAKEIQQALKDLGFDPGPIDGDIGPLSIAAITSYQRSRGLVPDGIAGPLTQAALKAEKPVLKAPMEVPTWLTLAYADLGMKEGAGALNNARVVAMFADSGFPGIKLDSVAWCAAAVGSWLKRAGLKPSGSLAARSYESWGVRLTKPALGAIGVKKRVGGASWQGHVGLIVGASSSSIIMLGGNQSDAVTIASFPRSEFTAYTWPSTVPIPTDWTLPTTVAGAKSNVTEA